MLRFNAVLSLIFAFSAPIFAQSQSTEENLFEACSLVLPKDGQIKSSPFKLVVNTPQLKAYRAEIDGYRVQINHNNGQVATMTNEGLANLSDLDRKQAKYDEWKVNEATERAEFESAVQADIERYERLGAKSFKYELEALRQKKYEPRSLPKPGRFLPTQFFFNVEEAEKGVDPNGSGIPYLENDISHKWWVSLAIDSEQKVFDAVVDKETGSLIFAMPSKSASDPTHTLRSGGVINCIPQL